MLRLFGSVAAIALAGIIASPAWSAPVQLSDAQLDSVAAGLRFTITNQVSDQPGVAPVTDPLLVNAWGLSQGPPGFPLWVANNGSDTSTLYNMNPANGALFSKVPLNVSVPGAPTGTTFSNIAGAFEVTGAGGTKPSQFLFATESGTILAWNQTVDLTHAIQVADLSGSNAVFKGLTLGMDGNTPRLFASDLFNGRVDMFDTNFKLVGSFTDPNLPPNYSPFNVQVLNGLLYVTFAKHLPGDHDETAGQGLGFVDVFDTQGHLIRRLVQHGQLNAPWGLAIAPASFGKFAGALLVGNFGDGHVNAYDPTTGNFIGALRTSVGEDAPGKRVTIDGLWAMRTGPNGTITFSAGPDGESHGLVGSIGPNMMGHFGADEMVGAAEMAMMRH